LQGSTGTTTLVLVVMLVALGVAMVLTAVWLVHATRNEPPALAPLEAMGTRRWVRADADRRTEVLAAARPNGALGPAPTVPYGDEPEAPAPVSGAERQVGPADEVIAEPEPAAEPVAVPEPVDDGDVGADDSHPAEPVAAPESS
jgi:hypothetical protein